MKDPRSTSYTDNLISNRSKILSEYLFPLNLNNSKVEIKQNIHFFSQFSRKYPQIHINNLFKESILNKNQFESKQNRSFSTVSQNDHQFQVDQMGKTLFRTIKISNKNVIVQKKRLASTDISNVNQLNVSTFNGFLPTHQKRLQRLKRSNLKQDHHINKKFSVKKYKQMKVLAIQPAVKQVNAKLPKIQNAHFIGKASQISTNLIKWNQNKNETVESLNLSNTSQSKTRKNGIVRKNSISPWEDVLD